MINFQGRNDQTFSLNTIDVPILSNTIDDSIENSTITRNSSMDQRIVIEDGIIPQQKRVSRNNSEISWESINICEEEEENEGYYSSSDGSSDDNALNIDKKLQEKNFVRFQSFAEPKDSIMKTSVVQFPKVNPYNRSAIKNDFQTSPKIPDIPIINSGG